MSLEYRCHCSYFKGSEFQRITDLRDIGLAIYRHVQRNIYEDPRRTAYADNDSYIFYNCKDVDITSAAFVPEFDKNKISCPRCFYIVEHTQKLLHSVPVIEKNDIVGICDHCRTRPRSLACRRCDESVKRFVIDLRLNIWLKKVYSAQNASTGWDVHEHHTAQMLHPKRSRSHADVNWDTNNKKTSLPNSRNTRDSLPKSHSYENVLKKQHSARPSKTYDSEGSLIDSLSNIDKLTTKLDDHKQFGYLFPSNILKGTTAKFKDKDVQEVTRSRSVKEVKSKHNQNVKEKKSFATRGELQNGLEENIHKKAKSTEANDRMNQNTEIEGKYSEKYNKQYAKPRKGNEGSEVRDEDMRSNLEKDMSVLGKKKEIRFLEKSEQNLKDDKLPKVKQIKEKNKTGTYDDTLAEDKLTNVKHTKHKRMSKQSDIKKEKKSKENNLDSPLTADRAKNNNKGMVSPENGKYSTEMDDSTKNKRAKSENATGKSIKINNLDSLHKDDRAKNKNEQKLNTGNNENPAEKVNSPKSKRAKPSTGKSENAMGKNDTSKDKKEKNKSDTMVRTADIIKNGDEKRLSKTSEKKMANSSPQKNKKNARDKIDDERFAPESKHVLHNEKKDGTGSKKGESPKVKQNFKKETERRQQERNATFRNGKNKRRKEIHKSNTKDKPISYLPKLQKVKLKDNTFELQVNAKSKLNKSQKQIISGGKNIGESNQSEKSLADVSRGNGKTINEFSYSDVSDMKRLKELLNQELKGEQKKIRNTARELPYKMVPKIIDKLPIVLKHLQHKTIVPNCIICADSDTNLNLEEWKNMRCIKTAEQNYIKGAKVFKSKAPQIVFNAADLELDNREKKPTLFKSAYTIQTEEKTDHTEGSKSTTINAKASPAKGDGIIKYALSDRQFIEKGWTLLPVEKVVSKAFTFGMRPAHPEFDWFKHNKKKMFMQYDTGEKLADFDDNGRGRWFYKNGRIALDYYDSEELNGKQRIVIYSSGELDQRGRSYPITVLATFDYGGNGIVFDHSGKIRLKYNQKSGVVLDRQIGPVSHWKWHSLTDPLELKRVMMDTHLNDPEIMKLGGKHDLQKDNEIRRKTEDTDLLAIEFENYMKEKNKLLDQEFRPYQIQTKAFKVNEQFSLRIMDQATIHIIFRDGSKQLKLNIGMILDNKDIKDIEIFDVGKVLNTVEQYPAKSGSIEELQSLLANARLHELANSERQRLLAPAVDRVNPRAGSESLSALSSPFPPAAPRTDTSLFSTTTNNYSKTKKSSSKKLYHSTRFL